MNNENEKKWFVYVGDHHEGPFSPNEVHEKKNAGQVTLESYVWREGMPDWTQLSETKELLQAIGSKESQSSEPAKPIKKESAPQKKNNSAARSNRWAGFLVGAVIALLFLGVGSLALLSRYASEGLHARLRPTLTKFTDSVPVLAPLFKLVPSLSDLSADEAKELEQARSGQPSVQVKVAIGLSQNDSNRPVFYLATNLPNRTKFDLYLVGNSETLLNRLQFSGQNSVTTTQGFARSEVFLAEGGQLIPKGEYQIYVTESAEQEDAVKNSLTDLQNVKPAGKLPTIIPEGVHFIFTKTYFLGGPRDDAYLTRVKAFHEKVKQNADRELVELKQYSDTLALQFNTFTQEFTKIYQSKKAAPALKAAWKKDAATWQQINQQLEQTIQTWSPQTLQNEFFYGKIYTLVKNAYDSIKALFLLENDFIEHPPTDLGTFGIQHGKALSESKDALSILEVKMDQINKAPKSPSGLPTREGL